MPVELTVDGELEVVLTRVEGNVVSGMMERFLKRLLEHPDFRPGMNGLFDFSEFGEFSLDTPEVKRCADLATEQEHMFEGSRWAVVAPAESVAFGMARMYEMIRNPPSYEVRVFTDLCDAREWLGLPKDG